jgi:hypothetical protein
MEAASAITPTGKKKILPVQAAHDYKRTPVRKRKNE